MSGEEDAPPPRQLVDFGRTAGRLRFVGGLCAAGALVGCVAEGLADGLTFGVMGRWIGLGVLGFVLLGGLVVFVSALGGTSRR